MTNTNTWNDVAVAARDFGVAEGKYFINELGKVRTASKKAKKVVLDTRGKEMVVLDTDDGAVAIYITDLLTAIFGAEDADNFNEKALASARSNAGRTGTRRAKKRIEDKETGIVYKNIAEAAKALNINYDKLYNMFYTKNLTEVKLDNKVLTLIVEDSQTADAEENKISA